MDETRRAELSRGVTSSRARLRPQTSRSAKRRAANHWLEERGVREVSAYSTACPERARQAPRHSIQYRSIQYRQYRLKMKSDRPS
jgi:hypothetical protein